MASNQENKKIRVDVAVSETEGARKSNSRTTTISTVVPVQALAATWEQDGDDVLAAALRVFFLSHTLDPLTGEVHTVH